MTPRARLSASAGKVRYRRRNRGWIIKTALLGRQRRPARTRIPPWALETAIARPLSNPAVAAVMVNHDGGLWVERIDGRTAQVSTMPRGDVERIVSGLADSLGRPPGDRRPIVAEDSEADLVATALPSDGITAPMVRISWMTPPLLGRWAAIGLLSDSQAGRLRALVRDGANLAVASHTELARQQIVQTLLAEAAVLGQRVVHIQGYDRFHVRALGLVAIAATAGLAAIGERIEALADQLRPDRLVFSDPTVFPQPWLIDRARRHDPPCILVLHARRPEQAAGDLERLNGMAERKLPAGDRMALADAIIFTAAPGAPWVLTESGDAKPDAFGRETT